LRPAIVNATNVTPITSSNSSRSTRPISSTGSIKITAAT
jgi:hypothetical protein